MGHHDTGLTRRAALKGVAGLVLGFTCRATLNNIGAPVLRRDDDRGATRIPPIVLSCARGGRIDIASKHMRVACRLLQRANGSAHVIATVTPVAHG
jgi:hypothetical protein